MFVVIAAEEEPEGRTLIRRLGRWFMAGKIQVEDKSFLGCRYRLVTVRDPRRLPLRRLKEAAGRQKSRVLVAEGIALPRGCGLTVYRPAVFPARMAVAAASGILRQKGHPGGKMAGVSDPQGLHPWSCGRLLEDCELLWVYTLRPRRYEAEAERLMKETGALVLLTDDPGDLRGCAVCAALSAGETETRIPAPVVAAEGCRTRGCPTVSELELAKDSAMAGEIPKGVAPEKFLGAVVELGQPGRMPELKIDRCRIDGRATRLENLL